MQSVSIIKNNHFLNFISQNKVLGFFLVVFIISIAMIFTQREDNDWKDKIGTEIPNLVVNNFTFYQINEENLQSKANGREARKYKDYEELLDAKIEYVSKDKQIHDFTSPYTISKDSVYTFPKSVEYKRNDGLYFYSQEGTYSHTSGIFDGKGEFVLKDVNTLINGINIKYDTQNKIVSTQKVKATLKGMR